MKNNMNFEEIFKNNNHELENIPDYNNYKKQLEELMEKLKNELDGIQKKDFEELIKIYEIVKSYECYASYKIGFKNGSISR